MSDTEHSKIELVVSPDKIKPVVTDLLGYEIDDDGYILDDNGRRVKSTNGEPIPIEEIGYLGSGDDGELEPVPDNFSSIVEYLSDRSLAADTDGGQSDE